MGLSRRRIYWHSDARTAFSICDRTVLSNAGVYFFTCEIDGRKYVKIGRSTNIRRRRTQLQSGCPFRLRIEHAEPLPEKEAREKEREWNRQFQRARVPDLQLPSTKTEAPLQFTPKWFPFEGEIREFVETLKAGVRPDHLRSVDEPQARLFE